MIFKLQEKANWIVLNGSEQNYNVGVCIKDAICSKCGYIDSHVYDSMDSLPNSCPHCNSKMK